MIINVGARTDIVHRFTPWLLNRLREGFVITRNPLFPNRVTRYELTPDKVDAILFCSKNYEPILPYMAEIARDYRIYCYYTITAYGKISSRTCRISIRVSRRSENSPRLSERGKSRGGTIPFC